MTKCCNWLACSGGAYKSIQMEVPMGACEQTYSRTYICAALFCNCQGLIAAMMMWYNHAISITGYVLQPLTPHLHRSDIWMRVHVHVIIQHLDRVCARSTSILQQRGILALHRPCCSSTPACCVQRCATSCSCVA